MCPLVEAFLSRLLVELDRASIYVDLIDGAEALLAVEDTGAVDERIAFCCRAALWRLAPPIPRGLLSFKPELFKDSKPLAPERFRDVFAALKPMTDFYNIEVAEAKMCDAARDAAQLRQEEDSKQSRRLAIAWQLLEAAQAGDAAAVGRHFYAFLYSSEQGAEALVSWARALVEMRV